MMKQTRLDKKRNLLWYGRKFVMSASMLGMIEPTADSWSDTLYVAVPGNDGVWSVRKNTRNNDPWLRMCDYNRGQDRPDTAGNAAVIYRNSAFVRPVWMLLGLLN